MDLIQFLIPAGGIISLVSVVVYEKYLHKQRTGHFSAQSENNKEIFAQELCSKLMRERFWCQIGMVVDLALIARTVLMHHVVVTYFLILGFCLLLARYHHLSREYATYKKFLFHKKCAKLLQEKP
jgi:hypothetical protein